MTPTDAERAIYVDYEASTGRAPTLLGLLDEKGLRQAVVEPLFRDCAGRYRVRSTVAGDHAEVVKELLVTADREERRIVAWSEFDAQHMAAAVGDDVQMRRCLSRWYYNAIPLAKRWRRTRRPRLKLDHNGLAHYLRAVGYHVPRRFGTGVAGEALRTVRRQLSQGRIYTDLSRGAKEKWRAVVRHNRYDCEGMREAIIRFSSETPTHRGQTRVRPLRFENGSAQDAAARPRKN